MLLNVYCKVNGMKIGLNANSNECNLFGTYNSKYAIIIMIMVLGKQVECNITLFLANIAVLGSSY